MSIGRWKTVARCIIQWYQCAVNKRYVLYFTVTCNWDNIVPISTQLVYEYSYVLYTYSFMLLFPATLLHILNCKDFILMLAILMPWKLRSLNVLSFSFSVSIPTVCFKTKLTFHNCKNNVIAIVITIERTILWIYYD